VSSLNQPRIGQALAIHRFDERIEAVERVDFDRAFVESEGELINVSAHVLLLMAGILCRVTYRPSVPPERHRLPLVGRGGA
jgi:hypothetical protein